MTQPLTVPHRPHGPPSAAPARWELPARIRDRLGADGGPQRVIAEEGHVLVVLHDVPAPDSAARRPALFWRTPTGQWQSTEGRGVGAASLDAFLGTYASRLQELEQREDAAKTAATLRGLLEEVAPILRASRGLHRALQQAREAAHEDRALIDARDKAAGIERTAELLLQDAQFGLEFVAAQQAENQAEHARQMAVAAHRFNVIAAVTLPLTAIASLLAMDVKSGLPNTPENFVGVLGIGLFLGGVLGFGVTRRA
jgi:hypothetical protein